MSCDKISVTFTSSDGKQKTINYTHPDTIDDLLEVLLKNTCHINNRKYLENLTNNCVHCKGPSDTKCYKCNKIVCVNCYGSNTLCKNCHDI